MFFLIFRNNQKGNNYAIRRTLTRDSKSDWFLNDKQVKLKEVRNKKCLRMQIYLLVLLFLRSKSL